MSDENPVVVPWQLRKGRNTDAKADVVVKAVLATDAKSVIDIGCNAGAITRALGAAGLFAVGIDQEINLSGVPEPLRGACLGNIRFTRQTVATMPEFDAATVLSVHHHFIREMGDQAAKDLIGFLGTKIRKVMVFEVSSKSKEYGADANALFKDEDEGEVVAFTLAWLKSALPEWDAKLIWRNVRRPRLSNRYSFVCIRP